MNLKVATLRKLQRPSESNYQSNATGIGKLGNYSNTVTLTADTDTFEMGVRTKLI